LFGPSGCGKTTILRCLAGLERPENGRIEWGDEVWFDAERRRLIPPQQRQIGYLFQDYALFPFMTVAQNVAYGLQKVNRIGVEDLLDRFQLTGLNGRYPHELSGGQQQRVALARAVIRKPRLLLLDEPLSALDVPTRNQLRQELRQFLKSFGIPTILVTHDPMEAVALAERVVVLDHGRILQQGKVEDVFSRPVDLGVARIVGMETVVAGRVSGIKDGMLNVRVGTATIFAVAQEVEEGEVYVCIRAEDVILQPGDTAMSSARNRLRGRITALTPEGPLVRVTIDCGFDLTALITKQSSSELELQEGGIVTALIKAPAVHIIPYNRSTKDL
jgi:molybdate transport system ATP-binding protein